MRNAHYQHYQHIFLYFEEHAIASGSNSPQAEQLSLQGFTLERIPLQTVNGLHDALSIRNGNARQLLGCTALNPN